MTSTALYRHFDASGALLYVGISDAPATRTQAHNKDAHWSTAITASTVHWFATRAEAEMAEWVAIRDENPAHNIRRPKNPPRFKPEGAKRAERMEPAATVIEICGGIVAVAEILDRHEINVRRWMYPVDRRGGTGGLIPSDCQQTLYRVARERGIDLRPEHFFVEV